jgi:hypothetical protein
VNTSLSHVQQDRMLVFACLAKDCARTLPNLFLTMDNLRQHGVLCGAGIGENGSKDVTRAMIIECGRPGVELIDTSEVADLSCRLERIARAREIVRLEICEAFSSTSYVCVLDTDDVLGEPVPFASIKVAMDMLDAMPSIYAVSATSLPWYYDLLAYKSGEYDFSRLESEIQSRRRNLLEYYEFHRSFIYPAQRAITHHGTHMVRSAFNGLCIYRFSDYSRGSYTRENNFSSCEHVVFNESVSENGRRNMLIMNDLRVTMPLGHGPSGLIYFFWLRICRTVKRRLGLG